MVQASIQFNGSYMPKQITLQEDTLPKCNSMKSKALQIINSKEIHLVPQNHCFSVRSGSSMYSIFLGKPKATCTCPSTAVICSHILAAYLSIGIEPDIELA